MPLLHPVRRSAVLALFTLAVAASPAAADQVVADDQIIQGSACIGIDCINNESFGFDTLRLKENNTRITFEDTSASPGFPTNDWTLAANESPSGARNIFMLQDITGSTVPFAVMAGAPTNSLFTDPAGQIGLGTSSPDAALDIERSGPSRLRFTNSDPGTQTWDLGGDGTADFSIGRPGQATAVTLKPAGDLATAGALQQNADPTAFENTTPVDPAATLEKVRALPLNTWRYAADSAQATHLGPNGTDFRTAFGLGSANGTVAPADLAGVSLVGVQALAKRTDQLDASIAEVRALSNEARPEAAQVKQLFLFGVTADKRIGALEEQNKSLTTSNAKLSKRLRALERRVTKLARGR